MKTLLPTHTNCHNKHTHTMYILGLKLMIGNEEFQLSNANKQSIVCGK